MIQTIYEEYSIRRILAHTRATVLNPNLKRTDIIEWAFGRIWPGDGEIVVALPKLGCNVSIPKYQDRRPGDKSTI